MTDLIPYVSSPGGMAILPVAIDYSGALALCQMALDG